MNTTISITKETRALLQEYGKKSESYDDVIRRMHHQLILREKLREFVDETQWHTLEEAEAWLKKKYKAKK